MGLRRARGCRGGVLLIPPTCPSDLDGDGIVDAADITLLLGAWGSADPGFDLDQDGVVGGGDLGVILGAWGVCG